MRLNALFWSCTILFLVLFMGIGSCPKSSDPNVMHGLVINAVKNENDWLKDYRFLAVVKHNPFFKESVIFQVKVAEGIDPPLRFLVTVDKNNRTLVFSSEISDENVAKFSQVIKKENINLDESNLITFINAFLFLADFNSKLLNSIDEIKYLPQYIMSDNKLISTIKPIEYFYRDQSVFTKFYTWKSKGEIKFFQLELRLNGEIKSYNVNNILKIPLYK